MRIGRWFVVVVCGVALSGAGCQLFEKPKNKGPSTSLSLGDKFNEMELVRGTNRLLEQTYVDIVSVSGTAAQNTRDVAIQEDTLRWRIWATSRIDGCPSPRPPFRDRRERRVGPAASKATPSVLGPCD